jgi:hypothetical protein
MAGLYGGLGSDTCLTSGVKNIHIPRKKGGVIVFDGL